MIVFIAKGERFSETKKRLQHRLGVSDKDFSRFKFALIQMATFKQPSYIEDGPYTLTGSGIAADPLFLR